MIIYYYIKNTATVKHSFFENVTLVEFNVYNFIHVLYHYQVEYRR